jgi:hypothetical protein
MKLAAVGGAPDADDYIRACVDDLKGQLERLPAEPALVEGYRARALRRAGQHSWESVADQYDELLTAVGTARPRAVCTARGPGSLPAFLVDREPVAAA